MTITDKTIAELRRRYAEATPLPWKQDDPNFECIVHQPEGEPYHYLIESSDIRHLDGKCEFCGNELADIALIVAIVNAGPGLLDEIARLRDQCNQHQFARDGMKEGAVVMGTRIAELEAEIERWRSRANMLAGETQRLAMALDIANKRIAELEAALRERISVK